jgi:SNF2 family DNA or RNA helicase
MGLGKTVQALALLTHRAERGPALVIAPTSVGFNWLREADRFAPSLAVRAFRGKGDEGVLAQLDVGAVVVTSYDLLARYSELLGQVRWSTLVLDEAQAIKNPDTRRARAAFALQAEFRLALTGTPVENRTGELWSLFNAVAPGLLGSAAHFRERFAVPIERGGDVERRALLARSLARWS